MLLLLLSIVFFIVSVVALFFWLGSVWACVAYVAFAVTVFLLGISYLVEIEEALQRTFRTYAR